jgi:hypothetical protein
VIGFGVTFIALLAAAVRLLIRGLAVRFRSLRPTDRE